MSRRRISSAKRQSRLRRSSSGPGDLQEDSNVFETDDPFWYKRMEANNTVLRPSFQLSNAEESTSILDSGSDIDMPPPRIDWWNPLNKFNQTVNQAPKVRRTIRSSANIEPTAEESIPHEESLDSLPEKDPRKRKKRLFVGSQTRETPGDSAFLKVLNDSATTVISDPGPNKRRKSIKNTSFLSDEDSFRRTKNLRHSGNYKIDEETCKFSPSLKTRKSRPVLFTKIRTSQSESTTNVFNNLLENVSSSTESSIPALDKNQQTRTFNESQKSGIQNTKNIEPSQDASPVVSQEIRSKNIEESHNSDQNLSQNLSMKQRTTRSSLKMTDTSVSSTSKAKTSFTEERKRNSTLESNSSDVEMKKRRPQLFRNTRKSMATNAFDNIFTSEEESTHEVVELNKSRNKNSSIKSLEKIHEEKQNRTNLNESHIITSPFVESSNRASKLKVREDLSDSNSEIDVEYKNDESTKGSREGSVQSSSRNRKSRQSSQIEKTSQNVSQTNSKQIFHSIPVVSVSRLKHASNLVVSEEEEDLISIGTQIIIDQSNPIHTLSINKQHNSSLNKSTGSLKNLDSDRRSSRLHESIKVPERLSIFAEKPQYESTRKIDIPKSRKSQESKRASKLHISSNEDYSKELIASKSTTRTSGELKTEEFPVESSAFLNLSKKVFSSKQVFYEEETSDIEVSGPKNQISTTENRTESRHSKSESKNNETRSDKSSEDSANSQNPSSEKERSVGSRRSHTISLSEGGSIRSEIPSENDLPLNESSKSDNQNTKTNSRVRYTKNFIPSEDSTDEENLEENNLSKKQTTAKPIITGYEILKDNNIDLRKLKGDNKIVSKANNTSKISKSSSAIQDISASNSIKKSSTLTKDPHMSLVEEEFRRLHGEENSEIASTSREYSQVSRNLFREDVDNGTSKKTSNNESSSNLRKILEDEESDSEVSVSPFLVYFGRDGEEAEESEVEERNPTKNLQRKPSPLVKEDVRDRKQKMISEYFKRRDAEKTGEKSQSKRISCAEAARNKNLMEDIKKQVENIIAPVKAELFQKRKEPEPPKKKLFVAKETSKKKKVSKPVDPAFLVNGVVYKQPRLPRPKRWVTDHLYKFIWKKLEPKYKGNTRIISEKFILKLSKVVDRVERLSYKNYINDLENLIKDMARLGLIVNRKDFNDFCIEFLPFSFRLKATPILLPGNKMSIPYNPVEFYAPILNDDSSSSD